MKRPTAAAAGWYPKLEDYIDVSYTNAVAFGPPTPCH